MATVEDALVDLLEGSSGVHTLAADRIYPRFGPPGTDKLPFVLYQRTGGSREISHDGDAGAPTATFTVFAVAATYTVACQLGDAIRTALQLDKSTWGGVVFQMVEVTVDGRDGMLVSPTDGAFLAFTREVDCRIEYEDSL